MVATCCNARMTSLQVTVGPMQASPACCKPPSDSTPPALTHRHMCSPVLTLRRERFHSHMANSLYPLWETLTGPSSLGMWCLPCRRCQQGSYFYVGFSETKISGALSSTHKQHGHWQQSLTSAQPYSPDSSNRSNIHTNRKRMIHCQNTRVEGRSD